MSPDSDDNVDVITALMLERERYTGWLHDLEEMRARSSAHVFERVRSDYDERLHAVMEKLAGRAAEVEAAIATHAGRLHALRSEEQTHRDERDEAELRAAVGEYTSEQWEGIKATADEIILRLRGEQETVGTELSRLEHVLSVARPARPEGARLTPEAQPTAPVDREVEREQPAARAQADGVAAPATPRPAEAPRAVEAPAPHASRTSAGAAERTVTVRDTPGHIVTPGRGFDELAFLNSVMEAPETMSRGPAARRAAEHMVEKGAGGAVDLTAREGLGSMNSKTLRCAECGTMNVPTEWYCERCGGELSAL